MKQRLVTSATLLLLLASYCLVSAQEEVTVVAPTSEAAEGLDLKAVSELFKDSENLEEFEKALNDPDVGINNLDLDENGQVDFIRVVEEVAGDTHVIILQVPLAENEFQDVATIEVEKTGDDGYNMQVHGNEVIYGVDYYVVPTYVHIHTWPIIPWIYRPVYRPYRSVFYFGFYPRWWRPYRPVTLNVYRTRTVKLTRRPTFSVTKTSRVKTVTKVHYKPHSSTLVKKKTKVTHTAAGTKGIKKVTKKTTSGGKTTTVTKGVKKTKNKKTGKTTVKKGAKKTTKTKGGKKKTVKKGGKKRTVKRKR
ncbi:MAG: hypothetical protein ACE5IW_12915 [bacterium]